MGGTSRGCGTADIHLPQPDSAGPFVTIRLSLATVATETGLAGLSNASMLSNARSHGSRAAIRPVKRSRTSRSGRARAARWGGRIVRHPFQHLGQHVGHPRQGVFELAVQHRQSGGSFFTKAGSGSSCSVFYPCRLP